ncbi:DUF6271 domain-containing protein [Kibdelosporangium persicum]|uniref:Glycosyltransferase family 2 protein n=1 Tax=Kibdelosporangium persicum TaxID=2698649 RepID=A0ABX2F136_9PSEU|nr:DUF6271 family protein [Kibdelosporangium persicum]NRN64711.1 hypothetical protein [Kibdelosporangium persicum]
MQKICLSLPTNRACAATVSALIEEAGYAADTFAVEVHVLILDSSDEATFARHAEAASGARPDVIVHHLNESAQRDLLSRTVRGADVSDPDRLLDLMLPDGVAYGACTNRAFLFSSALGCASIHRRDSDSRYQELGGRKIFPIQHELGTLGKRAIDAADAVSETDLDLSHAHQPVVLAGASFVGEMSVDIDEIRQLDPEVYYDVVGLWAPSRASAAERRALVDESFLGAENATFTKDRATLTVVDPMHVDMCNIAFHSVHEQLPLPPAKQTIGSDYFLFHVIRHAALPGVHHNRHIVNYYTPERRTPDGFVDYQTRLVKFFLSMPYLHHVYDAMAKAGKELVRDRASLDVARIAGFVRESMLLSTEENAGKLDEIDRAYRKLGGKYERLADLLSGQRRQLIDAAVRDMDDFAFLIDNWRSLVRSARSAGVLQPAGT